MEQPDLPENGQPETDDDRTDRRFLLILVGGILLAFTFGLILLAIALLTDWKSN